MKTIDKNYLQKTLKSLGDGYRAINYVKGIYPNPDYPERVKKPKMLEFNHSANDAADYAKKLAQYETAKTLYDSKCAEVDQEIKSINTVLEEYLKDVSGVNELPLKTASKIWSQAWEDGHSSGYSEVYGILVKYVELFEFLDLDSLKER